MEAIIESYDERRDIVVPGNAEKTILFSVNHFLTTARNSIQNQGYFAVALSGGSTPKAIYQTLAQHPEKTTIDWSRVLLFWGDERNVPLNHSESNYHMAMEAGFKKLSIPTKNIFPMPVQGDLEKGALQYEKLIQEKIPRKKFDLVMLGMGEDGHTASLFPFTHALHAINRLVVANYIPQKNTWRMTITFDCINTSEAPVFYVMGGSKAAMVKTVLTGPYQPDLYPSQRVGTSNGKALWVLDNEAYKEIAL